MSSAPECLNEKEYLLMKDTWGNVEKRLKLDGNRIFIRLFRQHPEYRLFFPEFCNLTEEQLKINDRLKAHVLRLCTSLNMLIWATGDTGALDHATRALVTTHHCRGVRATQLAHFNQVFNEYISYVVRTPEARAAWAKAMGSSINYVTLGIQVSGDM